MMAAAQVTVIETEGRDERRPEEHPEGAQGAASRRWTDEKLEKWTRHLRQLSWY